MGVNQSPRLKMSEKLNLQWNDFQNNISTAFGCLRGKPDFSDVTLACEDGQQVEAHKVILASSSPFFKKLLKLSNHPHPLIYMRGVKSEDLLTMMDFLYKGETEICQERVETFLSLAGELNLKGLTRKEESYEEEVIKPAKVEEREDYDTVGKKEFPNSYDAPSSAKTNILEPTNDTRISSISDNELREKVRSMMTKSQNIVPNRKERAYTCTLCGKEGQGCVIKAHIEANHLEGVSLPCNLCDKVFRTRVASRKHQKATHSSVL